MVGKNSTGTCSESYNGAPLEVHDGVGIVLKTSVVELASLEYKDDKLFLLNRIVSHRAIERDIQSTSLTSILHLE